MQAVRLGAFDGLDGLSIADLGVPVPSQYEVLVRVHTVGVNRMDLLLMHDRAPGRPALPLTPGLDPAGEVVATGDGVTHLVSGDRVLVKPNIACRSCATCQRGWTDACPRQSIVGIHHDGGLAEYVVVPVRNAFVLPDDLGAAAASALAHSYPIALQMMRERGRLHGDDVVLVTGATGAVGAAAVQIAAAEGARTIAVVSTPQRADVASASGADVALCYGDRAELTAGLRDAVDARGVTMVVDTAADAELFDLLRPFIGLRGRVLFCGAQASSRLELDLHWLYRQRVEVIGSASATYEVFAEALAMAGAGTIAPRVHAEFPLEDTVEAYTALEQRRNLGKIIVRVSGAEGS